MLHENNNYKIVLIEDCEDPAYYNDTEAQYAIMNTNTNRTEATASNMPQALLTATQFDRLLSTTYHEQIVEEMFKDVPSVEIAQVVKLFEEDPVH